jgi:hypothetical protein
MSRSGESDLITVFTGTLFEASLVEGLLKNEGIPAFVRDVNQNRGVMFLSSAQGGVKVDVPERDLEKAQKVVESYFRSIKDDPD